MVTEGFFISPHGKLMPVPYHHIDLVCQDPEKFGLTRDFIKSIFGKYKEPLTSEGRAREAIIILLIKKGWIRIRQYFSKASRWSIQVNEWNPETMRYIQDFLRKGIKGKYPFAQPVNPYDEVKVLVFKNETFFMLTYKDIL